MSAPKVLLIDDEEELVTTLVERLSIRGIEAEACTNGHQAIERIHQTTFDVVVADLKMPGLGGLEVVETLRQRHPDIKILLITGHYRLDDEKEIKVEGVHEVLMKPFSISTLIASIRDALSAGQTRE